MQLGVIGAGTMGRGIAFVAAISGHQVVVYDVSGSCLERARTAAESDLSAAIARGKVPSAQRADVLGRITWSEDLDSVGGATEAVIEAVPEQLDLKRAILREVEERVSEDCLIASNTSSLSITSVMRDLRARGRGIGMHFFNPVRSMPLCEVVVGLDTSGDSTLRATALAESMGRTPVVVKDSTGFVTSRINVLIGNEAFLMLGEGIASAADIDTAIKLGLRHPMGPFELADLVGLDVRLAVMREMHRAYGEKFRPAPLLERYVDAGRLGRKTGRGVYEYSDAADSFEQPSEVAP